MALQAFRCPNCNGELQMDDGLEKGYCMYCGSTIYVKDEIAKIKVIHSGMVEIDDSKKFANAIELADRAFECGNYEESYKYYSIALECNINNAYSVFRKGICAAYISITRVEELKQGVKRALEINEKQEESVEHENFLIFTELFRFIKTKASLEFNRPKNFVYPSLATANEAFHFIAVLTKLCNLCAGIITDEMIEAHPTYENNKRECLEMGLKICKYGTSTIKYVSGMRQVKIGDSYAAEEVYSMLSSPYLDVQKKYISKFKSDFNNLPTTRKTIATYDIEIEKLQKDVDAYRMGLDVYFKDNPEIGKEYRRCPMLFVILTGFLLFLMGIVFLMQTEIESVLVFVVVMVLLGAAFLSCGIVSVRKLVACKKSRKKIISELPSELASLKVTHDQSLDKLGTLKKTRAAFVRKNIKM